LNSVGAPVAVAELAAQVGLHPNTTRFHLDALVDEGLAERHEEERGTPGRPRALYTATPDSGALADIGSMPEAVTIGRRRRIELHHCPFREIAVTHGKVVCSLHLGLVQGLLIEIDASTG